MTVSALPDSSSGIRWGLPPIFHPGVEGAVANPHLSREVLQNHLLAAIHNVHVVRSIAGLLRRCCPTAIRRAVISINVDAVKRHAGRALTHIVQESLETIHPGIAHRYPASTIVAEFSVSRIAASGFRVRIRFERCRLTPSARVPVGNGSGRSCFNAKASATLCQTLTNGFNPSDNLRSTITSEQPRCSFVSMNPIDGQKAAITLARNIQCQNHAGAYHGSQQLH